MRMGEEWLKTWICLSFVFAWVRAARPRFDVSTDMGMVLVPADAEVDTAIFRLRATDQDTDFPLLFEIIATTSPIVRVENLPCTLYNKVCQANVILTRRLVAGRLHDFVVRVRDSKGDVNSMQATISVTNATTPRDKIFPHVPSLIMVPEDTKPEKELDYLLVESNPWSGKPVYIELWQPKELFKIRQRQMGSQTKGIITLIGELDFETQSMYTLTMYATDPYTEPGKDTRNIAGLHVVVIVQDVQDVPPVFTLAPPLTKINNSIKVGDVVLRVHAEDGDKGVPREVTYGLISEGNPFTPFFNVSETTGEIILTKPLDELTKITHVGAPIVLKIVAEEIRSMRDEPPAQATVVELGLLLGEPGNSPPYFENDKYVAWLDENPEPGTIIKFSDEYSTRVKDEDIGKAGVFALKLENNNGTFEVSPTVAERNANFVIMVRDNGLVDYETFRSLDFKIVAQEVGPATNLSASVPVTVFLRDVNDNIPIFDSPVYNITLSENANAGTKLVQVHATDKDSSVLGRIQYTKIMGDRSEAFMMNPDNGLVTVSMGSVLDREQTPRLELIVEARDEDGRGQRGTAALIVNILDVNDNPPIFDKEVYEFLLNAELNNFTTAAFVKASDADAEPPNNIVQYEIVHGNYENKFELNGVTGELIVREAINKSRRVRDNSNGSFVRNMRKRLRRDVDVASNGTSASQSMNSTAQSGFREINSISNFTEEDSELRNQNRSRRAEDNPLVILTVRAYDLGVPHLSSTARIRIIRTPTSFARIVMFVMPGENPDPRKTAETLATITGSRVTIQEIKPYVSQINSGGNFDIGKRSVVVARVEQNGPGTLVDVDKIRASLTANGFGIISGMDNVAGDNVPSSATNDDNTSPSNAGKAVSKNISIIDLTTEDVTIYKAENKLLTWLLILCGLLLLAAIIALIICCVCPRCPFYIEPRKRRIHSSETLVAHLDERPKRHLYRKPMKLTDGYYGERKEAWSADPGRQQYWQFNRRNTKNLGIASLPGDIPPGRQNLEVERIRRVASLRLQDDQVGEPAIFGEEMIMRPRVTDLASQNERIYGEDVDALNRNYELAELDSLRKHELERGSDEIPSNRLKLPGQERMREQHFYRDGNAEVLRLVTRGEIEDHQKYIDAMKELHHSNGKDILLQRFIEDQKLRRSQDLHDSFQGSFHEADVNRSAESHRRINENAEILILPERLQLPRQMNYNQRQNQQEQMIKSDIQRLIVERNYKAKDFKEGEADEYRSRGAAKASMRDVDIANGEVVRGADNAAYVMHDVELVRQNTLLTRLLLEKEGRSLNVPMVDNSSFLETQSLPGHVAIATQTDRTTATQTEFFARSRSDNEDIEEDQRARRKAKERERFEGKEDFKKLKTIWIRTPIPEETRGESAKKAITPTRTKIEVTESCKVSISPDILKEISSSLKSSESCCNEEEGDGDGDEDEDEKVLLKEGRAKPDTVKQKAHKLTSKAVCMAKRRMKGAKVEEESTTASPEIKGKSTLLRSKIRKKAERTDKVEERTSGKSTESEKNNFMEPSFRILEREISNFQERIRKFGDKKLKMIKRESVRKAGGVTPYDLSKKCEITMKKMTKHTTADGSPTKIYVGEKCKGARSDGEVGAQRKQATNSSSDVEDLDKRAQGGPGSAGEKTIPTRESRSRLRKQLPIQNSSSRADCEKSETRTDDNEIVKDSSSSVDTKMSMDSASCSSRDLAKRQNEAERSDTIEKKSVRDRRLATKLRPSGIVDIKRKVSSLEPKRNEKLDTNANEESKSGSSSKVKVTAARLKKCSSADEAKSVASNKSGQEVKERPTFPGQASKSVAVSDEALENPLELTGVGKTESHEKKSNESTGKSNSEEYKVLGSPIQVIDGKGKGKDRRETSSPSDSTSPTQLRSGDEISFTVIDTNASPAREEAKVDGKNSESGARGDDCFANEDGGASFFAYGKSKVAVVEDCTTKDLPAARTGGGGVVSGSNEAGGSLADGSREMTSDVVEASNADAALESAFDGARDTSDNAIRDNVDEACKTASDHIDETERRVPDAMAKPEEGMSVGGDKTDEAQGMMYVAIDGGKEMFRDKINESNKEEMRGQMIGSEIEGGGAIESDKAGDTEAVVIGDEIGDSEPSTRSELEDDAAAKETSGEAHRVGLTISDGFNEDKAKPGDDGADGIRRERESIIFAGIDEDDDVTNGKSEKTVSRIDEVINERREAALGDRGTLMSVAGDDESEERDATVTRSIVNATVDIMDRTMMKAEDADEAGDRAGGARPLKQKSTGRRNETGDGDGDEMTVARGNDDGDDDSGALMGEEALSLSRKNPAEAVGEDRIDKDNGKGRSAVEEETCKRKSISSLNGSFGETASESKKRIEDGEGGDRVPGMDSNKGEEASSAGTTGSDKQGTDGAGLVSMIEEEPTLATDKGAEDKEVVYASEECKGEAVGVAVAVASSLGQENDDSEKPATALELLDGEESEEDSSNASDVSNKTALPTKPYRTPRHSISLDDPGGTASTAETATDASDPAKSRGKPRQKWNPEREEDLASQGAGVEGSMDSTLTGSSQKMEQTNPTALDKPKISVNKPPALEPAKLQKSPAKDRHVVSRLLRTVESIETKMSSSLSQRTSTWRTRPVIVDVKRKAQPTTKGASPRGVKVAEVEAVKPTRRQSNWESRGKSKDVERNSRRLRLHVSHRPWPRSRDGPGTEPGPTEGSCVTVIAGPGSPRQVVRAVRSPRRTDHARDPELANARSRYMAWYQQKRLEMEKKRREKKEAEEERTRPRWLKPRPGAKPRKAKSAEDVDQRADRAQSRSRQRSRVRAKSSSDATTSNLSRVRVRPLVNVESEQLKAIVRQGRKLRKAEGAVEAEPEVQIFAPEKPPQIDKLSMVMNIEPRHHLTQHSEYKYEKEVPALPFYLHPPPVPQSSPELLQEDAPGSQGQEEDLERGSSVSCQSGTRLRHQQLLEKKSVFDIAYSEAAPTQLRSDSSTPPT